MPKVDIPDSWAANGRCPACGASGLKVTHLPEMADYMFCPTCKISFEVENGGRYVRLKHVPDDLEFVDAVLRNRWVEASKLSGIIARHRPVDTEKKIPTQPPAETSADDVWNRAVSMSRMGSSLKMIQLMLAQSDLSREQSDVILARLKKVSEEDAQQQQSQKFWLVAGISLLVVFLLAGSWVYLSGKAPVLVGLATVTPAPTQDVNQTMAVTMLLKLIPVNARPGLLSLPDTTVEENKGPAGAACPATPETAAKLFGGRAEFWNRDVEQFPSWQMVSPTDSFTVRVPRGMTAGYMDNKTFALLSINGPATIHNVNFLVITCD